MTDIPKSSKIMSLEPNVSDSSRRSQQVTADLLASPDSKPAATDKDATIPRATEDTTTTPRRSSFLEQDEGVLMDVLEELDRERTKRAEMEARVRVLEQEVQLQRKKNSKSSKTSMREYAVIKTERDGYKEILDALTQDRPAFSTASHDNRQQKRSNQPPSLPIHIVRLLEVMPWDSRAQQYTFGQEEVYEWQIYSADKKWQKELRYFPTFFKTLPIVMPTPGRTMMDEPSKSKAYFGIGVSPPKQCVLTDLNGTTVLNIDGGYPLPDDGGEWTWVGAWKVEKSNDTDGEGWSYSNEVEILSLPSTYHGDFRVPEKGKKNIVKRRRKWNRPRTLVDYPYASNMTREYLNLVAERSQLDSSVEKLSGQLVDTKMSLTTLEAEKERTDARIRDLESDLHSKNEILGLVENVGELQLSNRAVPERQASDPTKKVDEIRSAVTSWVSNTVQNKLHPSNGENSIVAKTEEGANAEADGTMSKQQDPKQQLFESVRAKGTGFLEILKQKGEQLDKIKPGSGGVGSGLRLNLGKNKGNGEHDGSLSSPSGKTNA